MTKKIRKVLILGSGGLKIGQAGEFDYSGTQAIKALREEGIKTVLVNPNIATIQTSKGYADKIYFLPVDAYFVEKVIEKEKPQGILLSFGGQTGLNTGLELFDKGILKKHRVQILGTTPETIKDTEDRGLFCKRLKEIEVKTAKSFAVSSIDEGAKAAKEIGFPVMIRVAYALGGMGSGMCKNLKDFKEKIKVAFSSSSQVLVEEYLKGWKEIEYEVVRDSFDNCITVCNMENFDPMGIHTGESIVVAPSQTLNNHEYHFLREIAIRTIRHLKVVGECNIQYAFNPKDGDYRVIEINARLSRSSALASKATGYPLAFVAAKLGLGKSLTDIENTITKVTKSCFEPALDYIVVKIPRWDLSKFKAVNRQLGTEMKSVGEIMAIGRKFEEALQKALRMLGIGVLGVIENELDIPDITEEIRNPTDLRVFAIAKAIRKGIPVAKLAKMTDIDPWFLEKIKNIVDLDKKLHRVGKLKPDLILDAKKLGFSDRQISRIYDKEYLDVRSFRKKHRITPFVKKIDTLAAEFPARSNYLFMTYNASASDLTHVKNSMIVLGGGPYRIGSSVEFDWCGVNCVDTLNKYNYETIVVNCNPETVSTDYDMCDRLYFEELSFERVLDIYEYENPKGMVVSMGGQMPNDLAKRLHDEKVRIIGTSPVDIDRAEDRFKFSKTCDEIGVKQPAWKELTSIAEAKRFAEKVGFPILIRPSYVLSGAAMNVAFDIRSLEKFLKKASAVSKEHPVVITKFIQGAKEIEVDGVGSKGQLMLYAITEHVENAGVHSGDATVVLPPQKTYLETIRKIKKITKKVVKAMNITGPFNIQYLAKSNDLKVIELNLRASRSFPFVSKGTKYNFIEIATKAMLGINVKKEYNTLDLDYVVVKAPQFSFSRLRGADPVLSVEMGSTGEVACFGADIYEAALKSILATGYGMPEKNIFLSVGKEVNKIKIYSVIHRLAKSGFNIMATEHTADFFNKRGIKCQKLYKISSKKDPNVIDYISNNKIDLAIVIPTKFNRQEVSDGYLIRRRAVDMNIPLISNLQLARLFCEAILRKKLDDLAPLDWEEYDNYKM